MTEQVPAAMNPLKADITVDLYTYRRALFWRDIEEKDMLWQMGIWNITVVRT